MARVVVVGHGMVAHRFLEELATRGLVGGPAELEVTVLSEESHPAYNRLLLPDVLRGERDLPSLTLAGTPTATVLAARRAVGIDRGRHVVLDDTGSEHAYDVLVLATGAAPVFPPVDGLLDADEQPLSGVRALRTWDDAVAISEQLRPGARVVVLGGGLLGVETARAMVRDGIEVTILHRHAQPLDRQLDPASGAVLRAAMSDLGITTLTDVRIAHVDRGWGSTRTLRLSDGTVLTCDLVVVAAGVRPRTQLAAAAGLTVRRGVVVDTELATDDPDVYAIGDCAETAEGCTGLVAPGWEQARVLADLLAERFTPASASAVPSDPGVSDPTRPDPTRPDPTRRDPTRGDVVRLKADGLDVVSMGHLPAHDFDPHGPRVVSLVDLAGRRSLRVAVEHGRLVGASCVGDAAVAADLTVTFEHGFPVPDDPAALLVRSVGGAAAPRAVADLPDNATICRCNSVSKITIEQAVAAGASSLESVAHDTRATTGCGQCVGDVCALLQAARPLIRPDLSAEPSRA